MNHMRNSTKDAARRDAAIHRHFRQERKRLRKAVRAMPVPAPWDWARPRIVPLLAGPLIDPPGERTVMADSELGPAVVFGVDLGGVYPLLDAETIERWEVSVAQLHDTALTNFSERCGRLDRSVVTRGTLAGRITTLVRTPDGLASSLVLVPDHLRRLIGDHDQILATPSRNLVMAAALDTNPESFASLVVDFEMGEPLPLLLDAFSLFRGELTWGGLANLDDID